MDLLRGRRERLLAIVAVALLVTLGATAALMGQQATVNVETAAAATDRSTPGAAAGTRPLAVADPTRPPGGWPRPATPTGTPFVDPMTLSAAELLAQARASAPPPTSAEAGAFIRTVAAQLRHMLSVTTGAESCPDLCVGQFPVDHVARTALSQCKRMDPEANLANPLLDQRRDGAVLDALTTACRALYAAEESEGPPANTAGWMQAVFRARDVLNAEPGIPR